MNQDLRECLPATIAIGMMLYESFRKGERRLKVFRRRMRVGGVEISEVVIGLMS